MSTRSLLEFNHDYIPRDDGDACALGVQLRNYMRASTPAELPKGVRLIARRRHSEPEFFAGWQPIKTAPKDGTEIDLWVRLSNTNFRYRRTNCWFSENKWWFFDDHLDKPCSIVGATHWMPLPEPPHDP